MKSAGYHFLIVYIFLVAGHEFLIKVTTTHVPKFQGLVVALLSFGVFLLCGLYSKKIREGFSHEIKNVLWASSTETLTFFGMMCLYVAMASLPASIVVSVAAVQPLFVLLFEWSVDRLGGKICAYHLLIPKFTAIVLIVIGVVAVTTG